MNAHPQLLHFVSVMAKLYTKIDLQHLQACLYFSSNNSVQYTHEDEVKRFSTSIRFRVAYIIPWPNMSYWQWKLSMAFSVCCWPQGDTVMHPHAGFGDSERALSKTSCTQIKAGWHCICLWWRKFTFLPSDNTCVLPLESGRASKSEEL